jgi:hypothetical protein
VLLGAAAAIPAAARGRGRESAEHAALGAIALSSNLEDSAAASETALGRIDAERGLWSTAALRRTTLLTGHGVAGIVFVPLATDAHYVWLDVPTGGRHFWFGFTQIIAATPRAPPMSGGKFD